MIDFLLITGPVRPLNYPPMALALLKGIVQESEFSCKTIDYNQQYFAECGHDENVFYTKTKIFENLLPLSYDEIANSECGKWLTEQIISDIKKHNPKSVGISCFSRLNNVSCFHLSKVIKENFPHIKIILGGYGIQNKFSYLETFDPQLEYKEKFADIMKATNLIDTYILGDAENELVNWLRDNTLDYADQVVITGNWMNIPYADYSDLDIQNYAYTNSLTLPVTGSKGCVRKCSFCDIPNRFGKFSFRSGDDIAKEVVHLYETYGAKTVYLTDSLTNGSLKAFLDFIEKLAELKSQKGYKDLQWTGQYIVRPSHQIPNPKVYYSLLRDSGAQGLSVGAESGSNSVLQHMKKKCTVDDILTEVYNFSEHDISCVLLLFPAYPTETRKDFLDTVKLLKKLQPYWCNGTITHISLGMFFGNDPLSEWGKMTEEQGMYQNPNDIHLWWYKNNPNLDYKEIVFRRLVLSKIANQLEMPTITEFSYMTAMHNYFTTNIDKIKKFHADIKKY